MSCPYIWSGLSPIIKLVIFFFGGCFKGKVYRSICRTEEDPKEIIRKGIRDIPAEPLQQAH
jgi:hypothetical protein